MNDMLPSSGEEYLRMVKAQARSCPVVVVAAKTQRHLSVRNTSLKYRTDWHSCRAAPEGCAPTGEWKTHFIKEFELARRNMKRFKQPYNRRGAQSNSTFNAQWRQQREHQFDGPDGLFSTSTSSPTTASSIPTSANQVPIPKMFDEQGWRALLYGYTSQLAIPVVHAATANVIPSIATATAAVIDNMQETATISVATTTTVAESIVQIEQTPDPVSTANGSLSPSISTSKAASKSNLQQQQSTHGGILPQPQLLARLNQGNVIQLLKYHLRWMAEDDVTDQQGKWLYALFLKLDPLVESDQVAILRNLAKKCARIRSHLNSDSGSKLATVNMVITIVAQLFGQNDLE
ncbi:gem (nuclear organelle) associated protein 2 [Mortierella claussenii]|nr:gem (nuclear organelle) associated protein 2 [Mortierella claussenii]